MKLEFQLSMHETLLRLLLMIRVFKTRVVRGKLVLKSI